MSAPFSEIHSFAPHPFALQWPLVISLIAGGLAASAHCLSMCGPLALAIATNRKRAWLQQLGRGLGYSLLGAIVGGLGPSWGSSRPPTLLSWVSLALLAAVVLVSAGKILRGDAHGSSPRRPAGSAIAMRIWQGILRYSRRAPDAGAFTAGLATFLLPCGQLYIFAAAALATGSPVGGATVLVLFWLGTLPAFVLGPAVVRRWVGPWAQRAPKVAAGLVLISGFVSIALFARHLSAWPTPSNAPDGVSNRAQSRAQDDAPSNAAHARESPASTQHNCH